MKLLIILVISEITLIIIVGEIKYRYEKQKENLKNNARENHVVSPFFPSELIEEEMKKML